MNKSINRPVNISSQPATLVDLNAARRASYSATNLTNRPTNQPTPSRTQPTSMRPFQAILHRTISSSKSLLARAHDSASSKGGRSVVVSGIISEGRVYWPGPTTAPRRMEASLIGHGQRQPAEPSQSVSQSLSAIEITSKRLKVCHLFETSLNYGVGRIRIDFGKQAHIASDG